MRISLVATGEPWPTDGETPRLLRAGNNAAFLSQHGHEVLWWNNTFDHRLKVDRSPDLNLIEQRCGYRMIGLRGGSYDGAVSIGRILYHRRMAKHFRSLVASEPRPDIIIASLTPLELSRAAIEYANRIRCPIVVDVRDLWPDIWVEPVPARLQGLARAALWPFYNDLRYVVRGATAISGITEAAVDWALQSGHRERSSRERAFPLAYAPPIVDQAKVDAATAWWREQGVGRDGAIVGCFFGALTRRADFETPLRAMRALAEKQDSRLQLVFCGRGEAEAMIRTLGAGVDQVIAPGWVDAAQIQALMQMSRFGLLLYPPTMDYARSLPNKVFEYLFGGLPLVTCLRGEIDGFFAEFPCGVQYDVGDPDSFLSAVARLTEDPNAWSNFRQAAAQAAGKFGFREVCERFEAYLVETAQSRGLDVRSA